MDDRASPDILIKAEALHGAAPSSLRRASTVVASAALALPVLNSQGLLDWISNEQDLEVGAPVVQVLTVWNDWMSTIGMPVIFDCAKALGEWLRHCEF